MTRQWLSRGERGLTGWGGWCAERNVLGGATFPLWSHRKQGRCGRWGKWLAEVVAVASIESSAGGILTPLAGGDGDGEKAISRRRATGPASLTNGMLPGCVGAGVPCAPSVAPAGMYWAGVCLPVTSVAGLESGLLGTGPPSSRPADAEAGG